MPETAMHTPTVTDMAALELRTRLTTAGRERVDCHATERCAISAPLIAPHDRGATLHWLRLPRGPSRAPSFRPVLDRSTRKEATGRNVR